MGGIRVETFKDDKLGLKDFAERLESFLLVERTFVDGGLVVSLRAPFGQGKSAFLRMWADDIHLRNSKGDEGPRVVLVNAWEDDFCGDPLLAMVARLVGGLEDNGGSADQARRVASQVAWLAAGFGNGIAQKLSGIDVLKALDHAEARSKDEASSGVPDLMSAFVARTDALAKLRKELRGMIEELEAPVFVLVDELDRCRPDYAIGYLETIKHVFDIKGFVFVFAVDDNQLKASAEGVFGALNSDEYLRKFFSRTIGIPAPSTEAMVALARSYRDHFVHVDGKRVSKGSAEQLAGEGVVEFLVALKVTLRQMQEIFRIVGHALEGDAASMGHAYLGYLALPRFDGHRT